MKIATSERITQSYFVSFRSVSRTFRDDIDFNRRSLVRIASRKEGIGQGINRSLGRIARRPAVDAKHADRRADVQDQKAAIVDVQIVARSTDFHGMFAGRFETMLELHHRFAARRNVDELPAGGVAIHHEIDRLPLAGDVAESRSVAVNSTPRPARTNGARVSSEVTATLSSSG